MKPLRRGSTLRNIAQLNASVSAMSRVYLTAALDGKIARPPAEAALNSGALRAGLGPFVHSLCHPLASHLKKPIPSLLVFLQASKPHALARLAFIFFVGSHCWHSP